MTISMTTFVIWILGSVIMGTYAFLPLRNLWRKRDINGFLILIGFCFFNGCAFIVQAILLVVSRQVHSDYLALIWDLFYIPATISSCLLFSWMDGRVNDKEFRDFLNQWSFFRVNAKPKESAPSDQEQPDALTTEDKSG
jgi:hypothetical protein